jgi:hypothetical protein
MQARFYYGSIWLTIGISKNVSGHIPYRISTESVKRFVGYMENPTDGSNYQTIFNASLPIYNFNNICEMAYGIQG